MKNISKEQKSKEADDWWGTQWNNLEQWGQDTWDVLFGWKVGQQAFAEEMDQSTHEIVKDINRLVTDPIMKKGDDEDTAGGDMGTTPPAEEPAEEPEA